MTINEIMLSHIIDKYAASIHIEYDDFGNQTKRRECINIDYDDYKKLIELAQSGVANEKNRNS